MTETPSPTPYSDIFLRQLLNSLGHATENVRDILILDDITREHALNVADLGLQHPRAWECTRELLLLLAPLMEQSGAREDWIGFLERGVERATEREDNEALGEYHSHLGLLYRLVANYEATQYHYQASVTAFAGLHDSERQGRSFNRWAYAIVNLSDNVDLTRELVTQAEQLCQTPEERGYSFLVRGEIASRKSDYETTFTQFKLSLECWKPTNNLRYIAWGWVNLATACVWLRDYQSSFDHLQIAFDLFMQIYDPAHHATALATMGVTYYHLGKPQEALKCYAEAMPVLHRTKRGRALGVIYNAVGKSYYAIGDWKNAHEFYHLAKDTFHQLLDIGEIVNVLSNMAETYQAAGEIELARATLLHAQRLLDQNPDIPSYRYYNKMVQTDLDNLE